MGACLSEDNGGLLRSSEVELLNWLGFGEGEASSGVFT